MAAKHSDERKQIQELVTRYKLHPDFRDVYVEGSWDKNLIEWVVKRSGVKDVVVYDIDTVHITPDMLSRHGFRKGQDGKKERVICLAYELQGRITGEQITCIADKDYDLLLERNHSSPLLLTTDFSCHEMYFMNEEVLGKFFDVVIGNVPVAPKKVLENLLGILQELHLLRAANLGLGWGLQWIAPGKSCEISGHDLRFRQEEFIDKYLGKGARLGERDAFISECGRLRGKLTGNPLNHVSKDDLFALLSKLLPKYCKEPAMHQEKYIARALAGCAELQYLVRQPLYVSLLARLSSRE